MGNLHEYMKFLLIAMQGAKTFAAAKKMMQAGVDAINKMIAEGNRDPTKAERDALHRISDQLEDKAYSDDH